MTVRHLRHDRVSLPTTLEWPPGTCGMAGFHGRPPWNDPPARGKYVFHWRSPWNKQMYAQMYAC